MKSKKQKSIMNTDRDIALARQIVDEIVESGISVTSTYQEWVNRAVELKSLGDEGEKLFLRLAEMDGLGYDKAASIKLFRSVSKRQRDPQTERTRTFASFVKMTGPSHPLPLSPMIGRGVTNARPPHPHPLSPIIGRGVTNALSHAAQSEDASIRMVSPPNHGGGVGGEGLLPPHLVTRSKSMHSSFCRALINNGILTQEQMEAAVEMYQLGATKDGRVIFWQIDYKGLVHEGKTMVYMTNAHRSKDKKDNPVTISYLMKNKMMDKDTHKPLLPQDWKATPCLFGEHLMHHSDSPIAIVESEKTAVICSQKMADKGFIWMASGGIANLHAYSFLPLRGRKIIIFPDTDPTGKTFKDWLNIAKQAERITGTNIPVSTLLERYATPKQKARKIDIADFLLEKDSIPDLPKASQQPPSTDDLPVMSDKLKEMININPALQTLIETFDLEEADPLTPCPSPP